MDIFEFAQQMEKDGENYYRELVGKTDNKGLRNIFTMLADEEVKHYNIIQGMKEGQYNITETKILNNAKNIFEDMKEGGEEFTSEGDEIKLYQKAQDIEKRSRDFYAEKAGEAEQNEQKEIFQKLSSEESKHYFLLDNIIEFVSRPQLWLENAEWYHLEEY